MFDHSVLTEKVQQKWRFMLILVTLSVLTFISGIDATIITSSLPTITQEIGAAGDYTWVAQSYLFACTIPQPLYGQLANIFGRSIPLLIFIRLFALGSGIAGGAHNLATLDRGGGGGGGGADNPRFRDQWNQRPPRNHHLRPNTAQRSWGNT
ncbi:hypothetical protein PFICI_03818 [Pestalotiopsis fici W106-1]|uniref:Major facilitator superfamily (MFS) profile domain-containing protein n=1 Tax=Pestalotiopsis fici (strain W106-1 / CGMCC3.15140) TaxID=1229662 RepID=W3XIA4_PESFW|nr:uncharacterized protein PFICI_03818 [Pestalotiopsis fici W106-1]ETS85793.1 hypothetical protein PFICI_03818 [Pestalotiopsis fici W106-1]